MINKNNCRPVDIRFHTPDDNTLYRKLYNLLLSRANGILYEDNVLKLLSGETVLSKVTINQSTIDLQMRVQDDYLQYKVNDEDWVNIIKLSDMLESYSTIEYVDENINDVKDMINLAISLIDWDYVSNKPFSKIGNTLKVDDEGTLDVNIHETINEAGGLNLIIG